MRHPSSLKEVDKMNMLRNKKVLITGGAGFVGTALVERLAKDNEVVLLDKNFDNNSFTLLGSKCNGRIRCDRADILDTRAVSEVVKDSQIIIHTAAVLGVNKVMQNVVSTLSVNFIGTANLLQAAASNSNCERVVVFSTSEIYGMNAFRASESASSVIGSIEDPRWCYAVSKLAGEHLALGYFHEKGLPVVVVRPFNVFGPGRIGNYAILRFIERALRDEDLEVYDDGAQIRAWCYIDDFCDALMTCLTVREAVGQVFNIGNPRNALTVYELAKKVVSLCRSQSKIVFSSPGFTDIGVRIPDISKARDILGFEPMIDMEEGFSRTIRWVRENTTDLSKSKVLSFTFSEAKEGAGAI
jgi:nucleoside-diphosphate-sugar epimerase